ncbi:MAG TPA: hypothetical protein VJ768_06050, partial [Anaerolineales bacterium]|nr:hypothetical protein [Anaerolineales bacterium]
MISEADRAVLQIQILFNGQIYTMRPDGPVESAVAFTRPLTRTGLDGWILDVGDTASILRDFGEGAVSRIDLEGKAVIPGLTDSHIHL